MGALTHGHKHPGKASLKSAMPHVETKTDQISIDSPEAHTCIHNDE